MTPTHVRFATASQAVVDCITVLEYLYAKGSTSPFFFFDEACLLFYFFSILTNFSLFATFTLRYYASLGSMIEKREGIGRRKKTERVIILGDFVPFHRFHEICQLWVTQRSDAKDSASFQSTSHISRSCLTPTQKLLEGMCAYLSIRWIPDAVSTGWLISPGFSANAASSNSFCISPRPKKPLY